MQQAKPKTKQRLQRLHDQNAERGNSQNAKMIAQHAEMQNTQNMITLSDKYYHHVIDSVIWPVANGKHKLRKKKKQKEKTQPHKILSTL